jgi:TPR repeat protein
MRERVVAQETFPHDMVMSEYKSMLWEEIQNNPPKVERPGDPDVDADLAYMLYMFYGNCSMAPRTEVQVDHYLKRLADQAQRTRSRQLDSLERRADQVIDFYELCLAIPPEVDCRMEAFVWMAEAVRLGHEIAQVQYYEKIKGFLMRSDRYTDDPPLAMKRPGLVEQFKDTARMALNLAMEKGHPEAYLAMSQAVYEGLIYPKDPVLALAYARVAEMKGSQNRIILRGLERRKHSISQFLDPDQVADAEELALELWRESSS